MSVNTEDAVPAEILQVLGRTGIKGINQVRCKVLDGKDKGKLLIRNIMGPVNKRDMLVIRETEMESAGGFAGKR